MVTAPAASKCRVSDSERLSGIRPGVSASAISATGTLTHSTQFQLSPLVRTPPRSTPTAPAEPATAPQAPRALLRSAPSRKRLVTIDRAAGERIAAPKPWAARAAISSPWLVANPASSEATATTISPPMNPRRLPSRSAARPPSSKKPPKAIRYALTTQGRFWSEMWRPLPMLGRATLTMDASRTTTNSATQSKIRAVHRRSMYLFVVVMSCSFWWRPNRWRRCGRWLPGYGSVCASLLLGLI